MASSGVHEPRRRARRRALQALYQWSLNPCTAYQLLVQFRKAQDFSNVDVKRFEALVRGVITSSPELKAELSEFIDREFSTLDVVEQVTLQIGAWELHNQPELPVQVILNEAVELARRFGAEQGHGFVNAVLDRAARKWRPGEFPDAQDPLLADGQ